MPDSMIDVLDVIEAEDLTELSVVMMVLIASPEDYPLAMWVVDHVGFVVEYLASRRRLKSEIGEE